MSKAAPFNGPSKTGNPSGGGRGNNPACDDDDEISVRWQQISHHVSGPSEEDRKRVALKKHMDESIEQAVDRIKRGTRADAINAINKLRFALKKHMSTRELEAVRAANREFTKLQSGLLEDYARVVRKARDVLTPAAAQVVLLSVNSRLGNHQQKALSRRLEAEGSWMDEAIRDRVTLEDLLRYMGLS